MIRITLAALLLMTGSAQAFEAPVIGIHDGDSITILRDGQRVHVRLAGIDAPEEKSGRKWNMQPYADEARAALTRMIGGNKIDVECTGQESYRRPVCRVYACKDHDVLPARSEHASSFCPPGFTAFDVHRRMVAEGAAWSAIQYEPVKNRDFLLPVFEIQARVARRGLWAAPAISPGDWRHAGK